MQTTAKAPEIEGWDYQAPVHVASNPQRVKLFGPTDTVLVSTDEVTLRSGDEIRSRFRTVLPKERRDCASFESAVFEDDGTQLVAVETLFSDTSTGGESPCSGDVGATVERHRELWRVVDGKATLVDRHFAVGAGTGEWEDWDVEWTRDMPLGDLRVQITGRDYGVMGGTLSGLRFSFPAPAKADCTQYALYGEEDEMDPSDVSTMSDHWVRKVQWVIAADGKEIARPQASLEHAEIFCTAGP